jgi:hypothetical protein
MRMAFRTIVNTPHEIQMGQKIWFRGIEGYDTVSVTANNSGFTPLDAVRRFFGFDYDLMNQAATACNNAGEVAVVRTLSPRLLLVPKTRGRGNTEFFIEDLFQAATAICAVNLHFTHYGFLQGRFPKEEALTVIEAMLSPRLATTIERVVIDVDERVVDKFIKELRSASLLERIRSIYE